MMKRIQLTENELRFLTESPQALRALTDYHDLQESQAASVGADGAAKHHLNRRIELSARAETIEAMYADGLLPEWEKEEIPDVPALLQECRRHLELHRQEYSHVHPKDLEQRIGTAILKWRADFALQVGEAILAWHDKLATARLTSEETIDLWYAYSFQGNTAVEKFCQAYLKAHVEKLKAE